MLSISQFNFTPILCVVTGAGRPGVVREAALVATASELAKEGTLRDSVVPALSGHAQAQARKLRGQRARDEEHRRQRHRQRGPRHKQDGGAGTPLDAASPADATMLDDDFGGEEGRGGREGSCQASDWAEKESSAAEHMGRAAAGTGGWKGNTFELHARLEEEEKQEVDVQEENADLVRSA